MPSSDPTALLRSLGDPPLQGQGAAEKFYEWEQKHELDVHVLALPDGMDPGDMALAMRVLEIQEISDDALRVFRRSRATFPVR